MSSSILIQIARDPNECRPRNRRVRWRHPGCQSPNHGRDCWGNLWHCARCQIRVCYAEGTDSLYELCDNCFVEVAKGRVYWPTVEAWEIWLEHRGLNDKAVKATLQSVGLEKTRWERS